MGSPGAVEARISGGHPFAIVDFIQMYEKITANCTQYGFLKNPSQTLRAFNRRLGLKKLSVGGAEVSEVHGNFIVNRGQSSFRCSGFDCANLER